MSVGDTVTSNEARCNREAKAVQRRPQPNMRLSTIIQLAIYRCCRGSYTVWTYSVAPTGSSVHVARCDLATGICTLRTMMCPVPMYPKVHGINAILVWVIKPCTDSRRLPVSLKTTWMAAPRCSISTPLIACAMASYSTASTGCEVWGLRDYLDGNPSDP